MYIIYNIYIYIHIWMYIYIYRERERAREQRDMYNTRNRCTSTRTVGGRGPSTLGGDGNRYSGRSAGSQG